MKGPNGLGWALSLLACLAAGCGGNSIVEPELGMVKGKVTVDGAPGANLLVTFEPQLNESKDKNVGASSTAQTDAGGAYELNYKGKKGAVVGKHRVRISAIAGGGPAGGESAAAIGMAIPAEFDSESNVIKEVQKGENSIDLTVTTK